MLLAKLYYFVALQLAVGVGLSFDKKNLKPEEETCQSRLDPRPPVCAELSHDLAVRNCHPKPTSWAAVVGNG